MQKLELTWNGKGGEPAADNMLIYDDNLLALKALEQEFAGRVKCIYIDIITTKTIQLNYPILKAS